MDEQIYYDNATEAGKRLIWWLYLMHGVSLVLSVGLLSFVPLIINYLKRDDTAGTFLRTHHSWQIRSFWWYLFWMLVGGVFFVTLIGIPLALLIWLVAWVWKVYRLLRGFLNLGENYAMPM